MVADIPRRSNSTKVIDKPLTESEFKNLVKVANDPFYFSTFIYVINTQRGKVKFDLYPYQIQVLWAFLHFRFNIILKFRQGGLTELIAMFCLWYAMYHSNKNINIISIKDMTAKKVLRKIKFMYRNLPEHLKVRVINGRARDIGTASEMEFSNGSIITSIPTTEEAGRSEALSLLVIDEAAIVRWADQIWAAAFPTLSTGGRAILNSTPYGIGNFFHRMWVSACSGGNPFNPMRLRWQMHPERGKDGDTTKLFPYWYNEMLSVLGPRRTAQEIDGDFLTSGNSVFDLVDIRALEEELDMYEPLNIRNLNIFKPLYEDIGNLGDALEIYSDPKPGRRYSIGADVATGRARDYSAITIMDDLGEESGCFKMKIPVDRFAKLLYHLGKIYKNATLGPESNDIGLSVAMKLEELHYPNIYYSKKLVKKKGEKKPREENIPGWYTTRKNRPIIIAELEEAIRVGEIVVKDRFFIQEAYTFIYDERNRPVAMGKNSKTESDDVVSEGDTYTDDSILAKAITNHIRKIRRKNPVTLPV